jgi:TolB-like protein/DNA-binding winged helix-turn-helix (wHTH) protein/lipoprotein NlpI
MISPGLTALHFRFGDDFELDLRAYQLRQGERSIKLPRIPMEVLQLLLEKHGELVTREQIVERIWGKQVFVDTDNGINAAIRKIRQVLADDADNPIFLQTVTGRGYRFIAPVTVLDAAPVEPENAVADLSQAGLPDSDTAALSRLDSADLARSHGGDAHWFRRASGRTAWILAAGALLVIVSVITFANKARWSSSGEHSHGRMMLAVLPFDNLTGDPSQDYFSDGLTEELITLLGRSDPNRLGVIARTSVMNYKHHSQPLDRVGKALNAQYILEGSVRQNAGEMRVNVQLIRANDQTHLWAQQYELQASNMLTLQTEIAQTVSDEMQRALGGTREHSAASRATINSGSTAAYELYLKGRFFLNKRTTSGLLQATEYFEQSIASDPQFARAYANLAQCYALMGGYTISPPAEYISKARAAALHALELDPNLAEAHAALALIAQTFDWDFVAAEKEYARAIEIDPNYATAHHWRAECLALEGRFDEALPEIDLARQLDPLSLIIATDRGVFLYFARRYDSAIQQLNTVLEMEPNFPRAHVVAYAYAQKGEYDSALLDLQRWRGLDSSPWIPAMKAYVYGRSGQHAQGREALDELEVLCRNHDVDPLLVAVANVGMGNKDSAFAWLEKAYIRRSSGLNALKVDPLYDPLRSDPRFENLLHRIGLSQ